MFKKWGLGLLSAFLLCSCSGDKTAGTDEQSEGITAIKNLDIAGVSQKGPFAKGSAVTVQGIDCKTLKFTDEVFEGKVKSDKGDFAVEDVTLSSACAVFEVTGNYFNEVTGKKMKDKITLHALTNLKDRKNVNINLLTELEYERVMNLASGKETSFADAKKQAEKEVLAAFGVNDDATDKVQEFENLNIFEKGDENAALLAVSVLMQGDEDVTSLAKRLEKFSDDFAEDGEWNDSKIKKEITEWAAAAKENGKLDTIRKNVETMNDGEKVDAFEKLLENSGVTLSETSVKSNGSSSSKNVSSSSSKNVILSSSEGFGNDPRTAYLNPNVNYGEMVDPRDGQVYKTITLGSQTWMAQNLNYDYKGSKSCYEQDSIVDCSFGRYYSWAMAIDSAALRTTVQKKCGYERTCDLTESIRGVCPEGWHLPDTTEFKALFDYVVKMTGDSSSAPLKTVGEWTPYVPEGDSDYNPHITEATNAIGFSIRPSGCYYCQEDNRNGVDLDNKIKCRFEFIHELTRFWASNDVSGFYAFSFVTSNDIDVMRAYQKTSKLNYYSVRCVKGELSSVTIPSSSSNVILSSSEESSDSKSSSSMKNTSSSSWSGAIGSSDSTKDSYLNPNVNYGEMTDSRDGQVYKTVKIGNQVWMAQNLNYADSVKTPSLKGKSWCYNDSTEYCEKYGRLYMWAAAIDSVKLATDKDNPVDCGNGKLCGLIGPLQGVCPDGWHLPSYGEWNALFTEVGGLSVARNVLKSLSGWNNNNNGSDAFGFSAFPVGFWSGKGGFTNAGYSASFWSSMEESKFNAYDVDIGFLRDNVDLVSGKNYGFSIRCLKGDVSSVAIRSSSSVALSSSSSALWTNAESSSSFVFDLSVPKESYLNPDVQYGSLVDSRDNQTYKTVQIGDQVWMAQNLNYASEGSACFNDTAAYCELFGRLYYWSSAMDSTGTWSDNGKGCGFKKNCTPTYPVRGVCPEGWHLPSAEEFQTLVATVGGLESASVKLMAPLGWYDHFMTQQFNPDNSTGFSAIAAGGKSTDGSYWGIGRGAGFFSSTEYSDYNARNMSLYPSEPAVGTASKNGMESVRCVKD